MDYTETEQDGIFLEGTSLLWMKQMKRLIVLFHLGLTSYLLEFCRFWFYPSGVWSISNSEWKRKLIYHTNVMMCLGETFAVICADCIDDKERKMVLDNLKG
jgi:hypothetical protein